MWTSETVGFWFRCCYDTSIRDIVPPCGKYSKVFDRLGAEKWFQEMNPGKLPVAVSLLSISERAAVRGCRQLGHMVQQISRWCKTWSEMYISHTDFNIRPPNSNQFLLGSTCQIWINALWVFEGYQAPKITPNKLSNMWAWYLFADLLCEPPELFFLVSGRVAIKVGQCFVTASPEGRSYCKTWYRSDT